MGRPGVSLLQDLRTEFLERMILLLFLLGWLYDLALVLHPLETPVYAWSLSALALVSAGAAHTLRTQSYTAATTVYLGSTFVFVTTLVVTHPDHPLVFAYLPLLGLAAILRGRAGVFALAGLSLFSVLGLWRFGVLESPHAITAGLLLTITAVILLSTLTSATQVLDWAWEHYVEAQHQARQLAERGAELARVSKSLTEAYRRLEQVNRELARAREEAERARQQKIRFAAILSHEMRTPLNLIIGFSEVMATAPLTYYGEPLPPRYREDLETIYRNAVHLSHLLDDVLDLAQIETGHLALNKRETDVAGVVHQVIASVANLFRAKGLTLAVDLPASLPPVWADPTRISQILLNLITNAARVTAQGGVRVSAREQAGEIAIAVSDTGPGIPPEALPRLFEEFYRLPGSPCGPGYGTGLGLAITKQLVELHGGSIWVESQVGAGTTFTFTLPCCRNVAALLPPRDWRRLLGEGTDAGRVLAVIDPEGQGTHLLQRHLPGYQIVRAETPSPLLTTPDPSPLAGIVVIGGARRLARRAADLTSLFPTVPIIGLTLQTGHRHRAEEFSVSALLTKPVTREQLAAALRRVARGRRTILIVDDEPEMARLLVAMVDTLGSYRVLTAHSAAEALWRLENEAVDVVLLDLVMPEVDGYTLLRTIRHRPEWRALRVIVVTAHADEPSPLRVSQVTVTAAGGLPPLRVLRWLQALLTGEENDDRHSARSPG
jgi:signal transduction histidine kinase/CheY-like chemotaxis protein